MIPEKLRAQLIEALCKTVRASESDSWVTLLSGIDGIGLLPRDQVDPETYFELLIRRCAHSTNTENCGCCC